MSVLTVEHLVNDFYSVTLPFLLPTLIQVFDLSFFEAGLLTIATSLLSGLLQPIIGYLADLYSKHKIVIQLGFFAFSLGLIIAGFSNSYSGLLVAFLVFGLGQATFHAQSTNLITRVFPKSKGRSMGVHGIGGSVGNFSAPIITTLLITALSWRYAIIWLAFPGLLMIIFLHYFLSKPLVIQKNRQGAPIISRKLILLAFNFGLLFMTFRGFLTFLPTFLVENGSSLGQAGLIATLMFFMGFLAQPVGGLIYDKFGGRSLFASSSLLISVGLVLISINGDIPSIVFIVIIGVAAQATYPVALAMGSEIAKGENVGASVGFVFGVSGVLASVSPALVGYAADSFGLQISFRLLAILGVLSLGVSFFLPAKRLDS